MSDHLLDPLVSEVILRICGNLTTPFSQRVRKHIEAREWDSIAKLRVDPHCYDDAETYWGDSVVGNLLRKMVDLPTSFDRKAVATQGFFASEKRCFRTNQRLGTYIHGTNMEPDVHVREYFARARGACRRILGVAPLPGDFEGRFGPGATFGDRGDLTTIPDKMTSSPTLTDDALPLWGIPWANTAWARAASSLDRSPEFVRGNRFTTVPKDCTKHRGIAIEPSVNLFYQLGIGRYIRNRLGRAGINLAKGQSIHRRVAREASITGDFATLDLSNASDTICTSLVKLVLPPDWFELLNSLRSPYTLVEGKWVLLEKFSSMGNGFTFELETLIFLCLILAVPRRDAWVPGKNVFVYGDDMIIPTRAWKDVYAVLEFCGLEVNKEKSYVYGQFRESCGGDYFCGVDVRPLYLGESPREPQQLISLANGIRNLSKGIESRTLVLRRAWFAVLDSLPSGIRACRGPQDLGDLVVHDDESHWNYKWRAGIRYFKSYAPASRRVIGWWGFADEVVLASALFGVSSGGESDHITDSSLSHPRIPWRETGVIPRDAVTGFHIAWVPHS